MEVPEDIVERVPHAMPGAARGDGAGRRLGAIVRHPAEVVLSGVPFVGPVKRELD